jgi:hypothetical protein
MKMYGEQTKSGEGLEYPLSVASPAEPANIIRIHVTIGQTDFKRTADLSGRSTHKGSYTGAALVRG